MSDIFNLDAQKAATIAKLEAIERVGLDLKALKDKLANLDVVKLVEDHVKAEVNKIEKYATKHTIPLTIDTKELIAVVKLPAPDVAPAGVSNGSIVMPFVPENGTEIMDTNWTEWRWSEGDNRWVPEAEWESSWDDSGC